MKTINFKEFGLFTGISKKEKRTVDVRESFANVLYCQTNGIKTHSLAFKIYNSEGEIAVDEEEAGLISLVADQYCTPAFIDAINEQLNIDEQ